jgi:hypothetical protein
MNDMDMKQKIREVREKFLSNNQIEDIRQNITLVVEDRLKFLSTKQTKDFEDLEISTKNLEAMLQEQIEKVEKQKINLEESSKTQLNKFNDAVQDDLTQIRQEQKKKMNESSKLSEEQIKTDLLERINDLSKSVDSTLAGVQETSKKSADEFADLRKIIRDENANKTQEFNESIKNELNQFSQKEKDIKILLDQKLIEFDTTKENLLKEAKKEIQNYTSLIEIQIKSFSEEQKTLFEKFEKEQKSVGEIIDDRLKEFRVAQKAAFEELEAALNLLEKHQDDTITKFKDKKAFNYKTLDSSLLTNRGSIESSSESIQLVEPSLGLTPEDLQKADDKKLSKPRSKKVGILVSFIVIMIFLIFKFSDLNLADIFSQ